MSSIHEIETQVYTLDAVVLFYSKGKPNDLHSFSPHRMAMDDNALIKYTCCAEYSTTVERCTCVQVSAAVSHFIDFNLKIPTH
jgi:hypothetical protein